MTNTSNKQQRIPTNIGITSSTQVMVELNGCLKADNLLILIFPRGLIIGQVPPLHQVLCCAITEGSVVQHSVDLQPCGLDAIFVVSGSGDVCNLSTARLQGKVKCIQNLTMNKQ